MPLIFSGSGEYPLAENILSKNVTVLSDGAFAAVENESFSLGYVEQVYDVGIMVSVILPIYEHVVYGQYSWVLGYNVIHSHLENVLAHFKSKWYMEKLVPAKVCVECCEE